MGGRTKEKDKIPLCDSIAHCPLWGHSPKKTDFGLMEQSLDLRKKGSDWEG